MTLKTHSNKQERFPCSDEHVPKENVVEKINNRNKKMWGPICKICDLYKHWCRCTSKVSSKTQ